MPQASADEPRRAEILARFRAIRCYVQGDRRAPYKPLLLLLALARVQRRDGRWVFFDEVEEALRRLLDDFGPPRRHQNPSYPFWRLQNDGLWTVPGPAKRPGDPSGTARADRGGTSPPPGPKPRPDCG